MNKYIRTKDGIIDTETYLDKCFVKQEQGGTCKWETFGAGCGSCRFNKLNKVEVIKQADTIEELCDCIVYVTDTNKKHIEKDLKPTLWEKKVNIKEIYGAIWTDKGLIYVAKMNQKGELELL